MNNFKYLNALQNEMKKFLLEKDFSMFKFNSEYSERFLQSFKNSYSKIERIKMGSSGRDYLDYSDAKSLIERILNWYFSEKGRETSPWREFYEKLIKTNYLPHEKFEYINYEHIDTHLEGIRYTEHLSCYEILIAEIYNLLPNSSQFNILKNLKNETEKDYLWIDEDEIESQQFVNSKGEKMKIAETALWIL